MTCSQRRISKNRRKLLKMQQLPLLRWMMSSRPLELTIKPLEKMQKSDLYPSFSSSRNLGLWPSIQQKAEHLDKAEGQTRFCIHRKWQYIGVQQHYRVNVWATNQAQRSQADSWRREICCRAKTALDEERTARLEGEEAAAQLNEQLRKARKDQESSQRSAQKQYEKLQEKFLALQVSVSWSLNWRYYLERSIVASAGMSTWSTLFSTVVIARRMLVCQG